MPSWEQPGNVVRGSDPGLAVADVERVVATELPSLRIAPEADNIQLGGLRPAKVPTVDDLEEGGVVVGGKGARALGLHGADDPVVGVVEEPLQFLTGEGPGLRVALVVLEVGKAFHS
ncbi:hypothetical protein [Streptomyces sp. ML-6]|uniref:hypothetical protein n=1 Tax=Streptomyces sp. ML-6 TaxID=2982693 RepID=UPI0024BF5AE8|nr:hypothetical protein [Streptomyces sp. ML-6]MDK0518192.1 hypothetical protein [Streptomyces sp. ML-6]